MKPAQAGISQLACNLFGRHIDTDPGPMMLVQPTEDDGKDFLAEKFMPLVDSSPALRARVREARRGETGGTTVRRVVFPGGFLQLGSAAAPASLRSKSIRILVLDEVDGYAGRSGFEGDPSKLAKRRTRTYWNRKIAYISTPTVEGVSRIAKLYEDSDQRRWFVPCPACGHEQVMRWGQVYWPPERPQEAIYRCEQCNDAWDDLARLAACRKGRWIATNPGHRRAGFQFASWITPWLTRLGDLAAEFFAAKRSGDDAALQVIINTEFGETWRETGSTIKAEGLAARAEAYDASPCQPGVCLITAGVDVQDNRVEIEVLGWGRDYESWSLEYVVVSGDPTDPAFWVQVDARLTRVYQHPSGMGLRIAMAAVDTGGHHTQEVYRFCGPRWQRGVRAIKGASDQTRAIATRPTRNNVGKIPLYTVGVHAAKDLVHSRFQVEAPGPGYCHFPARYGPDYYAQLASERRTIRDRGGRPTTIWEKIPGHRNEAWDCRVYATVACEILNPLINRWAEDMERRLGVQSPPSQAAPVAMRRGRRVRSHGLAVGGR